ncbi:MAG: hypothetical protein M3Y87_11600 [Myxococcota bacterium]|nr:hypothetical protein [Myxococcota bacterium]
MNKRFGIVFGLAFSLLGGCALDTVVDCANMCDRYIECFDPGGDHGACTTRCESRVDSGENDRADQCDRCLDDNSTCATAVAACGGTCGPLLAP